MEGGDLASVHSEEESAFISRLLPNRTCWIGANNVNYEEKWCWSDGSTRKNHSQAKRLSSEGGIGAVGIDFQGNWHRISTSSKEKHCFVCKLGKETNKEHHDGLEEQQDNNKGHISHSMWDFLWAIPVLCLFLLALGGAFYAKKALQKRREREQMRMELSSISPTCCVDDD